MSRRASRSNRQAARRAEYAVKLLLLGAAFVVVPLMLSATPLGKALGSLWPIGLLMMTAGGILLWLGRLDSPSDRSDASADLRAPARPGGAHVVPIAAGRAKRSTSLEPPAAGSVHTTPPQAWSTEVFNEMVDWRRFEAVVEALFAQAGFETKSQSHGADGGIDIWLYSRSQPGAPVSIVQCKHWSGRRVGVDKVRELRGVMAAHDIRRGQFATTSSFSDDAITFARSNGINLLDVDGLLQLIAQRTPQQQQDLLEVAYAGEYWRPTCVSCGIKLTERRPKSGGSPFWGCTNFPRCKTTMQMRTQQG
jgi:restriction system protein